MTKKRIRVSQATINEAIARREETSSVCTRCVITIALQKAFKTKDVFTRITSTEIAGQRIELPEKASSVTRHTSHYWDQLKPFSFTLTI